MQKRKSQKRSLLKSPVVVTGIVFVISLILIDLVAGGSLRLYATWAACGQKPVQGHVGKSMFRYYTVPGNLSDGDILMSNKYFCSPLEAEKEGYSASSLGKYMPNLHPND